MLEPRYAPESRPAPPPPRIRHTWRLSPLDLPQAMKSLQAMPAAGFRERAGYHRTRTTRCPRMGAVRVPGSTRHQDARMSLGFVSGSDWPPAPARSNAPRGDLRAASICNQFVAAQVEETEPRSRRPVARPPRLGGRRGRVAGGGNARRRRKLAPTSLGALRPLTTHAAPPGLRQAAQTHQSTRGTRQSRSDAQRRRRGLARRLGLLGL